MSDLSYIIIWWFTSFLIGIIFLPATILLFNKFIDKGYVFSRIIGIVLSSYLVWLLASFHILPFAKITIIIVLLAFLLCNYWFFRDKIQKAVSSLPWRLIILEEIMFFAALYFWSYVRAAEPSIRGLEKFMDFGFVNSILRSSFFPPLDMWLAKSPDYTGGFFINYYYFGHYITAFLTKLSGIDSTITYNLMIATLFAFTFTLSFSIGANLYYIFSKRPGLVEKRSQTSIGKLILAGLLSAFIVALAGNLHTLYSYTSGYPLEKPEPPWKLQIGLYPERYWYPNATRFIPFTIHEFPIYSFVVADLHGHVSDIPLVLLTIALLLSLVSKRSDLVKKRGRTSMEELLHAFKNHTSISLPKLAFIGIILASMYMTNAWDGLIYMILSGLVLFYINTRQRKSQPGITYWGVFYKTFSASLFLFFFFLVFSLPFSLNFKPFVSAIGVLCAPSSLVGKTIGPFLFEKDKCQKSPLWMLTILWGFFYYNVISFLSFIIFPKIKSAFLKRPRRPSGAERRNMMSTGKLFEFVRIPILAISKLSPVDIFVLIIIFISTLLLVFPEFFYIKDIYPAHYRANTMFKLGYQAFMLLGIASSYIIMRLNPKLEVENLKHTQDSKFKFFLGIWKFNRWSHLIFWRLGLVILFSLVAIYPYFAINSFYGGLRTYHGLYGLNWLKKQYPDDYQAIVWLRKNIQCRDMTIKQGASGCNNQPVIVEANGESYTDYARVSANTGLPTIIGWPVHEWLWRGSYDEAGKRIPEVANIYESEDLNQTKSILRKYNVKYIFLGKLEREKYKNLNEAKLQDLGNVVFESGKTKIFSVKM